MTESIHGRDIVALLAAQSQGMKEAELLNLIGKQFPQDLFHTCKIKGMDKTQILANMMTKGRIVERNNVLVAETSCGCKNK